MSSARWRWAPAAVLLLGGGLNVALEAGQRSMSLRGALGDALPPAWTGYRASDVPVSEEERVAAGMTSYAFRVYEPVASASAAPFSVYVGFYARQERGMAIHSPRNCLPGAGWEPLDERTAIVATSLGPVVVNRYLIQHGKQRALVLYWYQGRGRVAANEYEVKWELLRDRVLRQRSDEALVRVLVLLREGEVATDRLLHSVAGFLVPELDRALPG